jgi:NhaA family Na+:H+ antiporter
MSTDTAFVIGCLAILGSRLPQSLRLFLLALAIFDDVGAIMVVAIGYGGTLHGLALGLALAGFAGVVAMGWMGVRSVLAFFIVGGAIWLALDEAGIHPTLAGVALGLMTPAHSWVSDRRLHAILDRVVAYPPGEHWAGDGTARDDLHQARIATREALSPIERLEILLHPWVAFGILPLFALANAAIPFASATFDPTLTAAIIAAFVVGKPAGILLFSFLAEKLRIGVRSPDLSWGLLAGGGMLTGIGFTMALFIADLAFRREVIPSVKLGVLGASALSALAGMIVLFLARPSAGTARN